MLCSEDIIVDIIFFVCLFVDIILNVIVDIKRTDNSNNRYYFIGFKLHLKLRE